MLFAANIGIYERRMPGIVNCRQHVGIYVVHGFAVQEIFGEAQRYLARLPNFLFPVIENARGVAGSFHLLLHAGSELLLLISCEPENHLAEVLVKLCPRLISV